MSKYYVYILMDDQGVPFYVGKGSGDRYKRHLFKSHNEFVNRKINKLKSEGREPRSEIVATFDDEDSALETEVFMIRHYGLRKEGGLLCNLMKEKDLASFKYFLGKHSPVSKPVYHKGFIFPSRRFASIKTDTATTTFARMLERKHSIYLEDPFFEKCMSDYQIYEENFQKWVQHLDKRHPNAKPIIVDGVRYEARNDAAEQTDYSLWFIKKVVNDPDHDNIYYIED